MDPKTILERFRNALRKQGDGIVSEYQNSDRWTKRATRALADAGISLVENGRAVAKGHADDWDRSEYLTLDLVVLRRGSWGPPVLIAEHENSPYADRARYNAWKLCAVIAETRVLVAYFGGKPEMKTRDDLQRVVREVLRDNPARELILMSADSMALPHTLDELLALYDAQVIAHTD